MLDCDKRATGDTIVVCRVYGMVGPPLDIFNLPRGGCGRGSWRKGRTGGRAWYNGPGRLRGH